MTDVSLTLDAVRRFDRVVLATLGLFAVLLTLVPPQAYASVVFTLESIVYISPFLIVSVVLAASVKATGLDRQIAVIFSGRQGPVIVAAAVFGALSPFCSCGVVPIIAALLSSGVPLAPVMAFWIASPLMDPEMF
ncbi:MAG: permease, partial [Alphaproteobacteria bacterium]